MGDFNDEPFDNQPNMLDQFLVSKNMATGDALIKVNPGAAQILKPPAMVDSGLPSQSHSAEWARLIRTASPTPTVVMTQEPSRLTPLGIVLIGAEPTLDSAWPSIARIVDMF